MQEPTPVTDPAAPLDELEREHARLEARLRELENHLSLSPSEQQERVDIKKAKLSLKDRMGRARRPRVAAR